MVGVAGWRTQSVVFVASDAAGMPAQAELVRPAVAMIGAAMGLVADPVCRLGIAGRP
jgi:hypothetical protein